MSGLVTRRCWRCNTLALMEAFSRIFCDECQQQLDEIAAWRLAFWTWFDLARCPGWHERQQSAPRRAA